ncbi:adhesion G protein-coupled receptor B2 [Trichonephila clavipes]|nr:adhesion G protein-coupled receptor B2 [Trichonephila clavipes]
MIVQFRNEKVSNHGSIPITIDRNVVAFIVFEERIPPAHKAHQTVSFSGYNGVSSYTCGLASLSNAAVLFVDVAIQPEMRFIAKQNLLMKIGNNGNLVLGPFDESTPCLIIFKNVYFFKKIVLLSYRFCIRRFLHAALSCDTDAVDSLHHENPPTSAGVELATLALQGQGQTTNTTQSATPKRTASAKLTMPPRRCIEKLSMDING